MYLGLNIGEIMNKIMQKYYHIHLATILSIETPTWATACVWTA